MSSLKKAVVDKYYTFNIYNNTYGSDFSKFVKVIKKLSGNNLIINSVNEKKAVFLNKAYQSELNRRETNHRKGSLGRLTKEEFIPLERNEHLFTRINDEYLTFSSDNKVDLLKFSQERAIRQFVRSLKQTEIYTGIEAFATKQSFLLHPIRIKTKAGEVFFIDTHFTLYQHGYGILNASIRINNVDTQKFGENTWDIEIDSAYILKEMFENKPVNKISFKKIGRCTSIEEALDRYLEILKKYVGAKSGGFFRFNSMTILEMENQPTNFQNNKPAFNKDIYKLLFAPVTDLTYTNDKVKKRIEEQSKQLPNAIKIYMNSARFIMIYGKDIFESQNMLPNENLVEILYSTYRADISFILEKLLLRTATTRKYLQDLSNPNISIDKMYNIMLNRDHELRYETDQIFYNYATTREYTDFFFEKGIEESVNQAIENTVQRVKDLVILRKENRMNKISAFGTLLAVLFTVFFSITGIKEMYDILNLKNNGKIISLYIVLLLITGLFILLIYRDSIINKPFYKIREFLILNYYKREHRIKNSKTIHLLQKAYKKLKSLISKKGAA